MAKGSLTRRVGTRHYKKLVLIAAEGKETEPRYFHMFNDDRKTIRQVNVLKGGHRSAPKQVLDRLQKGMREKGYRKGDEAWLVVDRDQWKEEDLNELLKWSQEAEGRGLAVSNPKFEFWMLLHWENPKRVSTSTQCTQRLLHCDPSYTKNGFTVSLYKQRVVDAVQNAGQRDQPPAVDWPASSGSTVYRLVEKLV